MKPAKAFSLCISVVLMCLYEAAVIAQPVTDGEIAKWRKTAEAEKGVPFGIVFQGAESPTASGAVSPKGKPVVDPKGKKGFDPATAVLVTDPEILAQLNAPDKPIVLPHKPPGWDDAEIARKNERTLEEMFGLPDEAAKEEKKLADQKAAAIRDQKIRDAVRIIGVIGLLGLIIWKRARLLMWTRGINTPGRLKAIYLLWLFLNLMLLVFSPNPFGVKVRFPKSGLNYGSFYPFISGRDYRGETSGVFFNHIEQYDITEFVFYSLAPLVFWQAARMWRRDSQVARAGFSNTSAAVKSTVNGEDAPTKTLTIDRALEIVGYAENEYASGRDTNPTFAVRWVLRSESLRLRSFFQKVSTTGLGVRISGGGCAGRMKPSWSSSNWWIFSGLV